MAKISTRRWGEIFGRLIFSKMEFIFDFLRCFDFVFLTVLRRAILCSWLVVEPYFIEWIIAQQHFVIENSDHLPYYYQFRLQLNEKGLTLWNFQV
jgi:hypothetical protein